MPSADPVIARCYADEVQPHEAALRAWLTSRFPNLADVDDLVQESVLRVLRARGNGPILSPKSLLFVAARNLALNRLRDAQREPVQPLADFDLDGVLDDHEDIRETVARLEEYRVLIEAIQSLPQRCRQVMTLRRIYGLSQKEVAARLGISEHTVEAQSTIGLDKCAEFFRARGHVSRRS
ncbi:MAG: RNA polymerase sigma factor [Verrucomicrobia bacterium]|nr:RNA polymerase sigma factor [Verrucomicrobiota bacterium]